MKAKIMGVGVVGLLMSCPLTLLMHDTQAQPGPAKPVNSIQLADNRVRTTNPVKAAIETKTVSVKTEPKPTVPKTQVGRCWRRIMDAVRGVHKANSTAK